ncbi:PLAT domain-containing protein [Trichonephila clavipes]|nr:PLAT domain-containing protein [Trichonephila clavipes]
MGRIWSHLRHDATDRELIIHVTTGDRKRAGTDANVWLILYDEKEQATDSIKLNRTLKNDHERGRPAPSLLAQAMALVTQLRPNSGGTPLVWDTIGSLSELSWRTKFMVVNMCFQFIDGNRKTKEKYPTTGSIGEINENCAVENSGGH